MSTTAYKPEIKEAAKTLHLEGLSSREIRERLKAGTAGLAYSVEPGERTIDLWRRKWNQDGEIARFKVRDGDEQAVEDAVYRRFLGLYRKELQDFEDALLDGKATAQAVSRLAKFQATVDATRYQRQLRTAARERKLTPKEGASMGAAAATAKPGAMVEELIRAAQNNPLPT